MASRGKRRPFRILYYSAEREKGKVGGGGKKEESKAKGVEWPQRTHSKNLPPLFAPPEEAPPLRSYTAEERFDNASKHLFKRSQKV